MAKVGDIVRFLNSVGGGKIIRIENNVAFVEDEDGFETPAMLREVVVVGEAGSFYAKEPKVKTFAPKEAPAAATKEHAAKVQEQPAPEPVFETPEGDKLNIVLAYEPDNIKELSTTEISTYLVNDSNYYLYFTYATRENENTPWLLRYAGMVEPNIQLYLGELNRDDLPYIGHVKVQIIAFKEGKNYIGKPAVSVKHNLDTTKFAKLHCFKENVYFDNPVIALDIVTDDQPYQSRRLIDKKKAEAEAIKEKKRIDRPVRHKPVVRKTERRNNDTLEVDLHINELLDNTNGLSNADMLNYQIDEFRRVMDENLKNHGQKIIFIHGKGDGVLRNALMKELGYRYKEHRVQDASFREYGFGATMVTIK